jgi:hypothetical protein
MDRSRSGTSYGWLYKDTTGVRFCGVPEQVDLEVRSEAQDG